MMADEPDVIAYDENMGVIFQWAGCPQVESVDDLPRGGLAGIAISTAHLIRRRDGLVLKGEVTEPTEYGGEIILPVDEPAPREEGRRLKRVDLIPPPTELEEHEPLTDTQMLKIALWVALMDADTDVLVIEDRDILQAMAGNLSVERTQTGGVFVRAHYSGLAVIPVVDEAPKPRKRAAKKSEPGSRDGS